MLKGNNKLRLNEATLTNIIQEWLNRSCVVAPTAVGVSYYSGGIYEVDLVEPKNGEKK